jgi:hypothetical protein
MPYTETFERSDMTSDVRSGNRWKDSRKEARVSRCWTLRLERREGLYRPRSRWGGVVRQRSLFAKEVLALASRASPASRFGLLKSSSRKAARLGHGHVAAKSGQSLTSRARSVVIKSRLVVFEGRGRQSTEDREDYMERGDVDRNGDRGQLYGAITDLADEDAFAKRGSMAVVVTLAEAGMA